MAACPSCHAPCDEQEPSLRLWHRAAQQRNIAPAGRCETCVIRDLRTTLTFRDIVGVCATCGDEECTCDELPRLP
jgi:hypothetical protein